MDEEQHVRLIRGGLLLSREAEAARVSEVTPSAANSERLGRHRPRACCRLQVTVSALAVQSVGRALPERSRCGPFLSGGFGK
jgi:hypothetical protein